MMATERVLIAGKRAAGAIERSESIGDLIRLAKFFVSFPARHKTDGRPEHGVLLSSFSFYQATGSRIANASNGRGLE